MTNFYYYRLVKGEEVVREVRLVSLISDVHGKKLVIQKLVDKDFWDVVEDGDTVDFDKIEVGLKVGNTVFYDKDTLAYVDNDGEIEFALLTWDNFSAEWRVKYRVTDTEDTFWNFRVKFRSIENYGRRKDKRL